MRVNKNIPRVVAVLLLAALASTAQAHPGHGAGSLMQGLAHPLGLDHLLAMVAVGVWSVSALPPGKVWHGPAAFLTALAAGAAFGAAGVTLPLLEHGVALSVALFGVMLASARHPVSAPLGLGLVAAAALLHGLAHGVEAPTNGFAGYAAGFLLTTALMHAGGVGVGQAIRHWLAARSGAALGGLGALLSGAGLYLFGQLAS